MQRDQAVGGSPQSSYFQTRPSDDPSHFHAYSERLALRSRLRIIWNRRWLISAITLTIVVMTGVRTIKQKPVYQAVGILEIEMPRESSVGIQDFFPSLYVLPSYLETQSKIITSAPLTNQLADQSDPGGTPDSSTAEVRSSKLSFSQSRLKVKPVEGAHLVQVSYDSEDPTMAASIVNRLMSLYVKQNQKELFDAANEASGWLGDQIKLAKTRLDDSMETLRRFEREHEMLSVSPDHERLMSIDGERLQQLQQELAAIESTRIQKEPIYRHVAAGDAQLLESSLLVEKVKKENELESQLGRLSVKFGPNFPQVQRTQSELAEVRSAIATERDTLSKNVVAEYQSALQQEELLRSEVEAQRKKVGGGTDQLMQDNMLKRDVDLNQQAYEGLLQKLQEATTRASLKSPTAKVVDPAEPPAVSSHPGLARNLVLSLLVGLTLGVGIALTENVLRDTINTASEVELDLNLPLLGVVPFVDKLMTGASVDAKLNSFHLHPQNSGSNGKRTLWKRFRHGRNNWSHSNLSEAISNLRASLLFALEHDKPHAVLFSSPLASEGKTTISSKTAISLTEIGKKVLIIEGDLRRPSLHKVFSVSNRAGISEYLQGVCEWNDVVQSSSVPGLDIIICGERPENPAMLLSSDRMRRVIEQAKLRYDFVVLDSAILLNMADSRILASYVDGVVLIVKSRLTPKLVAKEACANLRGANARIVGAVLNQLAISDSDYSYSYYGYSEHVHSADKEEAHARA
jgi:succinoglycan biosynthesis transport protein ExoP